MNVDAANAEVGQHPKGTLGQVDTGCITGNTPVCDGNSDLSGGYTVVIWRRDEHEVMNQGM